MTCRNRKRTRLSRRTSGAALLATLFVAVGPLWGSASVYSNVFSELTKHDHRLPGSSNFEASLAIVSNALQQAGLVPQVQTFDTLVPHTESCTLVVDGKEIGPVFPLNNGVSPIVTGGTLTGPVVWMGTNELPEASTPQEALAQLSLPEENKQLAGSIVLRDLGSRTVSMSMDFQLGALAIVFVGHDEASQWKLAGINAEGPTMIPRFFVSRETATRAGLFQAEGKTASISATTRFRDVTAKNLWVEIPGKPGTTFRLDDEEAIILSSTLDTYGLVPDMCPQVRAAANVALLTEVACRLAQEEAPARSIFVFFFGSHYAAQEGTRYLYYALHQSSRGAGETDSLESRATKYAAELTASTNLFASFNDPDPFALASAAAKDLTQRIKEKLVGHVNNINAGLQQSRIEKLAVERRLQIPAADRNAIRRETARIDREIENLLARKSQWNGLRQQISRKHYESADATIQRAYQEVLDEVGGDLALRTEELQRMLKHNRTHQQLSARLKGRAVVGHFDFDLASDTDPWLFSVVGAALTSMTFAEPGNYLMHFQTIGTIHESIGSADQAWRAPLFVPALTPFYKPFSLCYMKPRPVPTAVGAPFSVAGYQMITLGDNLRADEMPVREPRRLSGLVRQMTLFSSALANRPELSLRGPTPKEKIEKRLTFLYNAGDDYGVSTRFVNYSRRSSDVEGPARNAVLTIRTSRTVGELAGISRFPTVRINAAGYVFLPSMAGNLAGHWGTRSYAFGFGADGRVNRCSLGTSLRSRIPLFYAYGGGSFSYGFSPDLSGRTFMYTMRQLNAKTDGEDKNAANVHWLGDGTMSAYFKDNADPIKVVGWNGQMALGATAEKPQGAGISVDARSLLNLDGHRIQAWDYWHLNESRLAALRERNIIANDLETLHVDAREHLAKAESARRSKPPRFNAVRAHQALATCLGNRIYMPLRGIANDMVRAVIVLLLLNIPFSFAMERLVFGFTSIHRQVLGFVGVFVVTFLILYVTHPAFKLAQAPIIIFLAFVIILLSTITLALVLSKIRQEIRAIQGLASTVHGVESDSSTVLAAVLIGISGMRNRPLKTLLTAITVVLLTFTILVFASFTSELGVVETDMGKGRGQDRIELNRFSYLDMPGDVSIAVATLYSDRFYMFMRGGMFRHPTRGYDRRSTPLSPDLVLLNPRNGAVAGLGAVLALDPREGLVNSRLAELAPGFLDLEHTRIHPPIYLPASTVQKLELNMGEEVRFIGHSFTYAGPFDKSVLPGLSTLGGARAVPPDFSTTARNLGKSVEDGTSVPAAGTEDLEKADPGNLAWFSPERIAIADIGILERYYPGYCYENFLVLYPKSEDVDILDAGRRLATVFQGAVHVKAGADTKRLFLTRAVEGSGFRDVIVPLLLGGLIIFSSLMGSIVDREREIFTYSALGLAPPDVGALFFAESAVYSVIGGMGGYLLSQGVAKFLIFLGSLGVFHPPALSFASLSSVLTILVVMAVVMLSTIFPAVKAGKSANPGVTRKWRMPDPMGDRLDFVFPFTVSAIDFAGILSFIKEHFENHGDASLGRFAANEVNLFKTTREDGAAESMGIRANVSLAPFDLGIFQTFRMYSKEFEIKGIEEVVVELERLGGTPSAWVRSNRAFADELRRQFLLWRSLPVETVEHYRRMTSEALKTDIEQQGDDV